MATPTITEELLIKAQLEGAYALLTEEVDVYEEQITPAGEVVHKKVGTRKAITAANLQAATSAINSKAVQKYFAEQSKKKTVNVREMLQNEKQAQIEVQDE